MTITMLKYTSKCCDANAKKPPLEKSKDAKGSLGTWSCSKCGKPCKVTRSTSD